MLRDTARYGVMAVGMTFVIVNKDLDLSVGSTYGLTGVVFAIIFSPTHFGLGLAEALVGCLLLGTFIGLLNGTLVTFLKVPAFIATLTTLLIGRGMVLGLTGGKNIAFAPKASEYPAVPAGRDQRARLQQPDRHLLRGGRHRRAGAGQDAMGLRDSGHRRQRAGGKLRRHQYDLGADAQR